MSGWSTKYKDEKSGVKIHISRQARFRIGVDKVDEFVKALTEFMVSVEADFAYVSKSWNNVDVSLHWSAR